MSYAINFLRCPDGLDADQAADWFESYEEPEDEADLSDADRATWTRLVTQAVGLLGGGTDEMSREHAELSWDSGVLLELWSGEATLSVPYSHLGEAGAAVMQDVWALALLVEDETGLTGFDPQIGDLLSEMDLDTVTEQYRGTALARSLGGKLGP
jgi:hypothetical protein